MSIEKRAAREGALKAPKGHDIVYVLSIMGQVLGEGLAYCPCMRNAV